MARILVIDDDATIGRMIQAALSREHEVSVCVRSIEAVARVEGGERFDVVLCDVNMPILSGLDVYAALRRIDAEQARRIVFFSAAWPVSGLPAACLPKPISLPTLRRAIAGFLPIRLTSKPG